MLTHADVTQRSLLNGFRLTCHLRMLSRMLTYADACCLTQRSLLNGFRLTCDLREKLFFLNAIIINFFILVFYSYEP